MVERCTLIVLSFSALNSKLWATLMANALISALLLVLLIDFL